MNHKLQKIVFEPSAREIRAKKLLDDVGIEQIKSRIEMLDETVKARYNERFGDYRSRYQNDWTYYRTEEERAETLRYIEAVKIYGSPEMARQRILKRKDDQKKLRAKKECNRVTSKPKARFNFTIVSSIKKWLT